MRSAHGSTPDTAGPIVLAPDLDLGGVPSLAFQPAVDLATGRLLGFEALLRWPDEQGNVIPPADVVAWAKANGHLIPLNRWVIEEACTQAVRWPSQLQVAVNCTEFQLADQEGAMAVVLGLQRTGLNPHRLTVEITENTVGDGTAAQDLCAMARFGIQVSVDDLTSHQPLSLDLATHAVSSVKIDGTIIAGLSEPGYLSRTIVETIIHMSHPLGISTVAEAVETHEQATLLRELGVAAAQGFFFSPPLDAATALELASMSPLPHFDLVSAPLVDGDGAACTVMRRWLR